MILMWNTEEYMVEDTFLTCVNNCKKQSELLIHIDVQKMKIFFTSPISILYRLKIDNSQGFH